MTSYLRGLALVFAFVSAGCGDPLSPARGDMFVLVAIGGDPLPAASMTEPGETFIADTMVILAASAKKGRVEHRVAIEHSTAVHRGVYQREYIRDHGLLIFVAPFCPINALCLFVPHEGRLDGDELVVTFADVFRTRVYRRVS